MRPNPIDRLRAALADRYRLERELGRGGMATVWRARDLRHERDVAIKVLRPELSAAIGADRFQREIRLTARLQHPNILPVFDSGEADGVLWYAMPLVQGASLRDRLDREGRLPLHEALVLTGELADALEYAHASGIVHRDIKPENILLAHGHALLADFGIARAVATVEGTRLTETGMAVGTLRYMSPEQSTADPAIDGRSDQYSLACVLHEMLTGSAPFAETAGPALLARRLTEAVPPLPADIAVTSRARAAVARALERDPSRRYPSLGAFATDLRQAPPATDEVPARRPSRRRLPTLVLGAAVALGLIVTAILLARRPQADVSTDPSVAVLPFENRSGDAASDYLSDGIADELIVRLTSQQALRVAPRSSVARLRGSALPLDSIARRLNVAHLVTGSVARLADSVRINIELVDVAGQRQQWARQEVVPARGVGELVASLADGILGSLRPGTAGAPAMRTPITRDSQAYDRYLRGRFLFYRFNERDLVASLAEFDAAIARDPAFAAAWLGRGSAMMANMSGIGRLAPREGIRAIREAVDTALALDRSLGTAYSLRGQLATWFEWDWTSAERDVARALALAPRDAIVLQRAGFHLSVRGNHDSALALSARARQLEPDNALMWAGAANFHFYARQPDSSLAMSDRVLALDPRFVPGLQLRAQALSFQGRHDEAIAMARELVSAQPRLGASHASLAAVLARGGRRAAARAILDSLANAAEQDPTYPGDMARAFTALGDRDAAFAWLQRALRERLTVIAYLLVDPQLDDLRADSRFAALLRDAGLADMPRPR
ncbi:MAG TPA: protein kinase [Gemmatimonadales bacterium]|nr:protein kinase [Gemmatimonadales bacterium]